MILETIAQEDTFQVIEEQTERIKCDSILHLDRPRHDAHWWALGPCGDVIAVCEDRRRLCRHHDGWVCSLGCNGKHPYDHIEWDRIPS